MKKLLLFLILLALHGVSFGTEVIIPADGADRGLKNDGTNTSFAEGWAAQDKIYVGKTSQDSRYIIPFQIPLSMAIGQHVTSAEFRVFVINEANYGNVFYTDIVGLDRYSNTATVTLADYNSSSTLITAGFLDNSTPDLSFQTSSV